MFTRIIRIMVLPNKPNNISHMCIFYMCKILLCKSHLHISFTQLHYVSESAYCFALTFVTHLKMGPFSYEKPSRLRFTTKSSK